MLTFLQPLVDRGFSDFGAYLRPLLIVLLAMAHTETARAQLPPEIRADQLVVRAEWQVRVGEPAAALASLDKAQALRGEHGLATPPPVWFRHARVEQQAAAHARAVQSATRYLASAGRNGADYAAALAILDASEQALQFGQSERREYTALRKRFAAEREGLAGAFADTLASGGYGPEMITIPGGLFRMGCVSRGDACQDSEAPVRRVAVRPFALSRHEVTFADWDACVQARGCAAHRPPDEGWGRATRPVIRVSWADAQAYAAWLSLQTGSEYRLPSEAEWEYAARAGENSAYSWGANIGKDRANCNGCGGTWDNRQTAPVGSFHDNAFGLYDMHGNVWEWVEDCWHATYAGAPSDSAARAGGDCRERVLRGGSWDLPPKNLRSAHRGRSTTAARFEFIGFRVARTLNP